jgi:ElaB/YqjD/DUF883 family membrane-anchored ribosome-binding protein
MKRRKDEGMLKEKFYELKDRVAEMESNFEDTISDHPMQSVATAFGVGFLAGALVGFFTRRR